MSEYSTQLGDGDFATGRPYQPVQAVPLPTRGPNPETPCFAYEEMIDHFCMIDDMWGGTETMQEAGQKWLPMLPGEDAEGYQFRLLNSSFFNAFKRTVQFLVGKAFSRPIKIGEKVPKEIKDLLDDIDTQGSSINIFLKEALTSQVKDGHVIFLVDHPDTGENPISVGEKNRRGLRPYVVKINPRNFLFWRSQVIDGKEYLTHVRIRETTIEPDGGWGEKEVVRVRVYDRVFDFEQSKYRVSWRLFRKIPGNQQVPDEYVEEGSGTMDPQTEIPIVCAYGEYQGFFRSCPPLLDLMFLNLDYWRSNSDQRHILHVARVPIKFAKGFIPGQRPGSDAPGKVVIGPDRLIATTEVNADLKYVEHTGQAIGSGFTDLENIKADMATMGAEKLAKKQVFTTATESVHDNTAEDSELSAMCKSLEDAFKYVFYYLAVYLGIETGELGEIEINKDFGIFPWQVQYLAYLIQLNQSGKISDKLLLQTFQRFGALADIVDIEAELKAAEVDAKKNLPLMLGTSQSKLPASPNPAGPAKP
jgi:hypothetical protein